MCRPCGCAGGCDGGLFRPSFETSGVFEARMPVPESTMTEPDFSIARPKPMPPDGPLQRPESAGQVSGVSAPGRGGNRLEAIARGEPFTTAVHAALAAEQP